VAYRFAEWQELDHRLRQDGIYPAIERETTALVLAKEIPGDLRESDLHVASKRFPASKADFNSPSIPVASVARAKLPTRRILFVVWLVSV
jgi:hypothetical protein